ncbi:hydrogenase subunit MbhD domain-containing protein [Marinospirillum alkaliphilum]|uniref:Multisubunit sodium/proton antiporter, MrpB subunit (TC 2.A.63.1) n=1 Tax=Marinospirillum alkaliphilum DSM 21637 TaxID=1122209 RepID=A0A1K1ZZR1_9GAMM|nr:hydrogenase subunit MbhD domain-containing protein [Marinospirillum alkaliphilum]SFX79678.1 multisubunit sodium/proton antiporter, MrpB subunit (TC 2.A.63.1) [Marinospirillum alkaliphilum DSM 21637]
MTLVLLFDLLLALGVFWLAWQTLFAVSLFRGVVSFMVFGLLISLVWIRLQAPDIALAEAAIGAGVTGALFLSALGRLDDTDSPSFRVLPWTSPLFLSAAALTLLVCLWLGIAVWDLPAPGLAAAVDAELERAGATHPVTAVLLNLRGFDTLLEVAVMLSAVIFSWSLGAAVVPHAPAERLPGLPALASLLHPVFLLVAAYLLWRGSHAPGGAFPAGAVLGAGGILTLLAGGVDWMQRDDRQWLLRLLLVAGLALFLLLALGGLLLTGTFMQLPPAWAAELILLVEVGTALSIALMLMAFYLYGEPAR